MKLYKPTLFIKVMKVEQALIGNSIFIIINNKPTDKIKRPVGYNTMKTGLSYPTCPGQNGILWFRSGLNFLGMLGPKL